MEAKPKGNWIDEDCQLRQLLVTVLWPVHTGPWSCPLDWLWLSIIKSINTSLALGLTLSCELQPTVTLTLFPVSWLVMTSTIITVCCMLYADRAKHVSYRIANNAATCRKTKSTEHCNYQFNLYYRPMQMFLVSSSIVRIAAIAYKQRCTKKIPLRNVAYRG